MSSWRGSTGRGTDQPETQGYSQRSKEFSRNFDKWLRVLKTRSQNVQAYIGKINFRTLSSDIPEEIVKGSWPRQLKRFSHLSAQVDLLWEQLYGTTNSAQQNHVATACRSVLMPIKQGYDPGNLRVKDINEIESEEYNFLNSYEPINDDESLEMLEKIIDDFNTHCLIFMNHIDTTQAVARVANKNIDEDPVFTTQMDTSKEENWKCFGCGSMNCASDMTCQKKGCAISHTESNVKRRDVALSDALRCIFKGARVRIQI